MRVFRMNPTPGIPENIPQIREEDLDTLAVYADREANPYLVPLLWDKEQLERDLPERCVISHGTNRMPRDY